MHPHRALASSLLSILLGGLLAAGCSELPCDIETDGGRKEFRVGEEVRARIVWDGKRADQVKRFKDARFVWRSDRDGLLGEGPELRARLTQGVHELVAEVWEGQEHQGYMDGFLVVAVSQGERPVARIKEPAGTITLPHGQPLRLVGEASDAEEGALDGSRLVWTIDGSERGRGRELVVTDLPVGTHTLQLTAHDSAGDEGRARAWVVVSAADASSPPPAAPAALPPPTPAASPDPAPPSVGFAGAMGQ